MLFDAYSLGGSTLRNRTVLAPMTRISADADGCVNGRMIQYYRRFAAGGFSLLITEGAYIDVAESQTYLNQPGMATEDHVKAWQKLVSAVHSEGSAIVAQLQHSGPQGQGNPYSDRLLSPSDIPARGEELKMYRGEGPYKKPEAASIEEIESIQQSFVEAALHAREAGFDGVEIHGANGYLIDAFLTDYLNRRTDNYGGTPENRVRFATETVNKVRTAVGEDFIVGIRISQGKVSDAHHKWSGGVQEALTIFSQLAKSGVDYIHTTEWKANVPAFPKEDPRPLSALAKQVAPEITVIANGHIDTGEAADKLLELGYADLVSIGVAALSNPDWPNRVEYSEAVSRKTPSELFGELAIIQNGEIKAI